MLAWEVVVMKLSINFLILSLLFLASVGQEFDEDGSGENISTAELIELGVLTGASELPIAQVGSFVVVDEPGKRRMCTCAEVQRCSFVHLSNNTRQECTDECTSNLVDIDEKTAKLTSCANEGYQKELEAADYCIRGQFQTLCSNHFTIKKASTDYWGSNTPQYDLTFPNPLHRSSVFLQKAVNAFDSIRKYQRCIYDCYRQRELKCREELHCAANYPSRSKFEAALANCTKLREVAFTNARVACKCMITRKNVMKLIGICSLFNEKWSVK